MGKAKGHYFYPGKPCHFMAEGHGCSIYEDRPKLCRVFECKWLTDPTVPEALWPGESRAVIGPDNQLIAQHGYEVDRAYLDLYAQWLGSTASQLDQTSLS